MDAHRRLDLYDNRDYQPGRGSVVRTIWYYVSLILYESGWLPVLGLKIRILRLFGAQIGTGVVIKPHVRIKYPWRLTVGDHSWIGQDVWIDNLDDVTLGSHSVLSQGAYLCCGSHDHRSPTFELRTGPIVVGRGAWVCARAVVLAGAVVGEGEVVPAGSVRAVG